MSHRPRPLVRPALRPAGRIALLYALLGGVWIFLSDYLLAVFFADPSQYLSLQTYKGWVFVGFSAALLFFLLRHELQRRAQAEAALKTSQEYAQNIIDSSLDMIIAVNTERKIIEFNQAAQEAFGYTREEVLGDPIDVLYSNPQAGLVIHKTTVAQGRCLQEILNRRKNGEVFPSFLSAGTGSVRCGH